MGVWRGVVQEVLRWLWRLVVVEVGETHPSPSTSPSSPASSLVAISRLLLLLLEDGGWRWRLLSLVVLGELVEEEGRRRRGRERRRGGREGQAIETHPSPSSSPSSSCCCCCCSSHEEVGEAIGLQVFGQAVGEVTVEKHPLGCLPVHFFRGSHSAGDALQGEKEMSEAIARDHMRDLQRG